MRSRPGVAQVWRIAVFLAGLICIGVGLALMVLPGPLTIPPVLLGLWIWSSEFEWARRFFVMFRVKATEAWSHAKRHPVSSAIVTVGGICAVGAVIWAVQYFHLIAQAKRLAGL